MSQIGGKMSKLEGEFVIVSIDLRIILSNYVAQTFTRFLRNPPKKICSAMFKTEGGGGVNGFLNNVKKTMEMVWDGTPYLNTHL